MKTVLIKADTRGHKNHGWLDTYHTFSFADYYDPTRIHFGALRVINDDTVAGGEGFGTHPHDNMEIVSIPLEGDLEHRDSMGNHGVIKAGDIQVMSAGTGVLHSEYNANTDKPVKFFQIWVFSNKKDVEPRYEQMTMNFLESKNKFEQIVSPDKNDEGLWIHQNAWFNIASVDKGNTLTYDLKKEGDGVFAMVIEGEFNVAGKDLSRRDGLGVSETDKIEIKALSDNARILLIEVPMAI